MSTIGGQRAVLAQLSACRDFTLLPGLGGGTTRPASSACAAACSTLVVEVDLALVGGVFDGAYALAFVAVQAGPGAAHAACRA